MDLKTFDQYLKTRYYDQLFYYENASAKNQKFYKNFQWALIILSTITTILAALPKSDGNSLQYIIVISAAAVTILTAALKTFQYQELWITYRATIEQLKPEIYYYEFGIGDYGAEGVDKQLLFVTRVEAILAKEKEAWPMFKQLIGADQKDKMDDLQKKLDELAREKFGTQKPKVENENAEPEVNSESSTESNSPISNNEDAPIVDFGTGAENVDEKN